MRSAVEHIVRSCISAAFEFIDVTRTEFSAASLALLVYQGDEVIHGFLLLSKNSQIPGG